MTGRALFTSLEFCLTVWRWAISTPNIGPLVCMNVLSTSAYQIIRGVEHLNTSIIGRYCSTGRHLITWDKIQQMFRVKTSRLSMVTIDMEWFGLDIFITPINDSSLPVNFSHSWMLERIRPPFGSRLHKDKILAWLEEAPLSWLKSSEVTISSVTSWNRITYWPGLKTQFCSRSTHEQTRTRHPGLHSNYNAGSNLRFAFWANFALRVAMFTQNLGPKNSNRWTATSKSSCTRVR